MLRDWLDSELIKCCDCGAGGVRGHAMASKRELAMASVRGLAMASVRGLAMASERGLAMARMREHAGLL